jgi:hypothetical protein
VIFPTYGLAEHTVYVCSNGRQRLVVDKAALETDRIVRVARDDSRGGGSGEVDEDEGDPAADSADRTESVALETARRATLIMMGCGQPRDSEGVLLKVPSTPLFKLSFILD